MLSAIWMGQAAADSGTDANQLAQAGDVEEATQAAADTGTDAGQLAQAEDGHPRPVLRTRVRQC